MNNCKRKRSDSSVTKFVDAVKNDEKPRACWKCERYFEKMEIYRVTLFIGFEIVVYLCESCNGKVVVPDKFSGTTTNISNHEEQNENVYEMEQIRESPRFDSSYELENGTIPGFKSKYTKSMKENIFIPDYLIPPDMRGINPESSPIQDMREILYDSENEYPPGFTKPTKSKRTEKDLSPSFTESEENLLSNYTRVKENLLGNLNTQLDQNVNVEDDANFHKCPGCEKRIEIHLQACGRFYCIENPDL